MSLKWTLREEPNRSRGRVERLYLSEVAGFTTAGVTRGAAEAWLQVASVALPLYPEGSWDHIRVHIVPDAGGVSFEPQLRTESPAKQRLHLGVVAVVFRALRENWRTLEDTRGCGEDHLLDDATFSEAVLIEQRRLVTLLLVAWQRIAHRKAATLLHNKQVEFHTEGATEALRVATLVGT